MECGRLFVTDKLYTRHTLDEKFLVMIDGKGKMLVTVRMNIVDALNGPSLNKGIEMLQKVEGVPGY